MSAQVIEFRPALSSALAELDHLGAEADERNHNSLSRMHFEAIYQLCFAPAPTPEQIAMEEFLLECD